MIKELDVAKKVIGIAQEIAQGVDSTRTQILEEAGRARSLQIREELIDRKESGIFSKLPTEEAELQIEIIATLDQMSRRMPLPLPKGETDRIEHMIAKLDAIRSSKERLPVSPGLCIWRGALEIRRHQYERAALNFSRAVDVLKPLVGTSPSVPPTLVTALCEGAYSLAMLPDSELAIANCEDAIEIARETRADEAITSRILREYFVAGESVTLPLATAFLAACDVRINLASDWSDNDQMANDFNVYWNLINDECGGLSALQIPYLIAILSDKNWMARRPDLSAPIARALYLKTASSIPHALWRNANLFFGGFRFGEAVKDAATSKSGKVAAAILAAALLGLGSQDALASNMNELSVLSSADVSAFFNSESVDPPSGSDIVMGLGFEASQSGDLSGLTEILRQGIVGYDASDTLLEVATGSSSLVGGDLV